MEKCVWVAVAWKLSKLAAFEKRGNIINVNLMFFLLDLTTCQPFSFGACIIQKKHVWQQTDARQGQTYSPGLHQ